MTQYKTSDIVLASTLKIEGFSLVNIEINGGTKGVFVFEEVPNEFLTKFDLGNVLVEPTAFNNTIRQLTTSVRRLLSNRG